MEFDTHCWKPYCIKVAEKDPCEKSILGDQTITLFYVQLDD